MKLVKSSLKRLFQTAPITLIVILLPFAGLSLEVKDVPNPRQINGTWVTDMAQILDESTEAQLNSMISQLEQENGAEIAVVTVPETQPAASVKEFTTALFNSWGIGKKGQDNGILFLISKGDRRVEIETGYGIESILPDAKVGNIIDTQITLRFKQGDFNGGTLAGTKALVVAVQPFPQSEALTEDATFPWGILVVGGGLALIVGAVVSRSRSGSGSRSSLSSNEILKLHPNQTVRKPSVNKPNVSSSTHCSQPHSHSSKGSAISLDSDTSCTSDDSTWNSNGSSSSSYDSSSSWSSDSSNSYTNYDSSPSSWSSDSSSSSSYDSSSSSSSDSSSYGGGSSGGGGAGSDW